jgi:hypothetical protein
MMKMSTMLILLYLSIIVNPIDHDIVRVNVPLVYARSGVPSFITIEVEIKDGFHIQANEVRDEFIMPTSVEIKPHQDFIINKLEYPKEKKFQLKGSDKFLDVYDGRIQIRTLFSTRKEIKKGQNQLRGKLNYQACDSLQCFFPRTVDFAMNVEIE